MEMLVRKWNDLQRAIYRVIIENRYDDSQVYAIDQLEFAEEEFGVELYDHLLELQEQGDN